MIVLPRIAAGLAWNRSPEHRWRQVSVLVSALVFMLLVLAGTSIVTMIMRESERAAARVGHVATSHASTDLFLMHRSDKFGQESIAVVWIEPASPDVEAVLPRGVEKLPAPGQAVVSPALDRLAARHPELASRYPDRAVLDWRGVRSGGELIAYVRPQPGRRLGGEESAVEVRNGQIIGEGPVVRVSGFGALHENTIPFRVGDPSPVPIGAVLGGVLALLVVPAFIVLAVGVSAASGVRDHRFAVLRSIGVRGRTISALAVMETLVLATPGLVGAVALWGLVSPRLSTVPLVGYEVVPGDLGLPWWRLLLTLLVAAGVTAALAVVAAAGVTGPRAASPRPTARRHGFARVRFVPLAVAVTAFVLGRLDAGYRAADYYLVGTISAVAAVPSVAPGLLRPVGAFLARSRSIPPAVAGRTLQWDPARTALPFVGGAALLVVVLAGIGYVTLNRDTDDPVIPPGAIPAVIAEWRDPQPGDVTRLADAVGAGLAVPFAEAAPAEDGAGESVVSIGARCADLAPYFSGTSCDAGSPLTLPAVTERRLGDMLSVAAPGSVTEVNLVPPADLADTGGALFIDEGPVDALGRHVRDAAMRLVPAPTVETTLSGGNQESPLVPWIIGGAIVAAIGLALACLLSLVDRLLAARSHHRLLINLGIQRRQLTVLGAWMFAAPYAAVYVVSLAAGLAICAALLLPGTPIPWGAVGATVAIGGAVGVVGTVCVAFLGTRSALKERE